MILRNATIQYAGYDPNELKPKSKKRICVSCDNCGRVRWIPKFNNSILLCRSCSKSGKNNPQYGMTGKLSPNFGKHLSDEHKLAISKGNKGKSKSNDHKAKIAKTRKDNYIQKSKIILICQQCGKEYEVVLSRKKSKFCSQLCFNKSQIGENNSFYEKKHSDKSRKLISKSSIGKNNGNYGRKHTKEKQEKINNNRIYLSGKDHPSFGIQHSREQNIKLSCTKQGINREDWNGFVSKGEYNEVFNKLLKIKIRNKYNNYDYISGIHKDIYSPKRELDVHHIDYNKQNCEENNLISLCKKNHIKTNTNRIFWNKLFIYSLEIDKWYYGEL